MESPRRSGLLTHGRAASSSVLNDVTGKDSRPGGSGTGSSTDSLASEVGRLSEENARYRQKIADLMGKTTAGSSSHMPPSRGQTSQHLGSQTDRMAEQVRRLKKENQRLSEQNSNLERRLSCTRTSSSGEQLWRYKEEVRNLRSQNADLKREKEKFDRTAEYVCQKVLKIITAARREGNFNSQLVGELKRWNEKLEDENHRLYNIIDRMQSKGRDMDDAVAEATVLSKNHDKDRDGNAAIVKELETQNVKIQEEMSKLSDQALSLQNLSSSSSGSSGPLPPRTPSNHELDGTASRRSRTPDKDPLKSLERQRGGDPRRKSSRAMSLESAASGSKEEFELLKLNNKKYTEEIERIGADLAYVRERVSAKNFENKPPSELDKLSEASARVASLEHANSQQAVEIERLMSSQLEFKTQSQQLDSLKDEFAELEDDCLKLATEVERLQQVAQRVTECEGMVEEYRQKLAALESGGSPTDDAERMKLDHVEMQRTLAAMAAEKAVLQAELRELLEERSQLQQDLEDLDNQVKELQERANSATFLQTELDLAKEMNQSYAQEIENLQLEKQHLKAELEALSEGAGVAAGEAAVARSNDERDAELTKLRAENEDLAGKAYNQVILNVELTTLRNQVKDLQDLEISFQEQIQGLKTERAALQKEADSIPALKAEIAELQQKVQLTASQPKRQSEPTAVRDSPRQAEVGREQEERGRKVSLLLEQNTRLEAELGRAETRLRSLQAKYDSLLRDHTQRSQQALREQEEAESQTSVLNLALRQERVKTANLAKEAAELHALLQTAHNERQSIQAQLSELRNENAKLVRRVTDLDARNEDNEKTLETVLSSRGMTNGHMASPPRGKDAVLRLGPEAADLSPQRSPFEQVSAPLPHKVQNNKSKPQEANGKADRNGFGSFFKKKSKADSPPPSETSSQRSPPPVPATPAPTSGQPAAPSPEALHNVESNGTLGPALDEGGPEQEVMDVYDRFVDSDDVDGFMTALGYKGFRSPTALHDMKGAFASAKYVVRPQVLVGLPEYQKQKAEATHDLLEAWHSAWVESLADSGADLMNGKYMMSL